MKCNGHFAISVIDIWGKCSGKNNKPGAILSGMQGFTSNNYTVR